MTRAPQPGIFAPPPPVARFATFSLRPDADPAPVLRALASAPWGDDVVLGVGLPLAQRLGARVPGLRAFPTELSGIPATQQALWVMLRQREADALFDAGRALHRRLAPAFVVAEEIAAFLYRSGRDLSGYEDGTENPHGDAAVQAALVAGQGAGLDAGSFVAAQRWVHDLAAFDAMSTAARDAVMGRNRETNEELAEAPESAHVKRTAQESFAPPAHILRRSMPYGGLAEHGLNFVSYGESLDRFERILTRMVGREDGTRDGLFSMSRPVTGGYHFCPPLAGGRLDLRALGL